MTTKFRTFNICQYEVNPKSGEDLHFNEENILECVSHKTIKNGLTEKKTVLA